MMLSSAVKMFGQKLFVVVALAAVASSLVACSGSSFGSKGAANKKPGNSDGSTGGTGPGDSMGQGPLGSNQNGSQGSANQGLVANPFSGTAPSAQDIDPCQGSFNNQTILILDLKSGWFAGDGGTFFQDRIDPKCPGKSNLDIHYYHVTQAIIETNRNPGALYQTSQQQVPADQREALICSVPFKHQGSDRLYRDASPQNACALTSLSRFSQIWLLSGDAADDLDITASSPLFLSLLDAIEDRAAEKPLGLFFGAGLGNTTHSNALAEQILGQPVFAKNSMTNAGVFPSTQYVSYFEQTPLNPSSTSTLQTATFLKTFSAFNGLSSLFDFGDLSLVGQMAAGLAPRRSDANTIFEMVPRCFADPVVHPDMTIVARDRCNQGVVGFYEKPGLRVYAEGNMARFYGLDDPQELVVRIAQTLALQAN